VEVEMRVKTDNGVTEVHFRDFEAVEPKVVEIRRAYREKTIDESEVERQINGLFGRSRMTREWKREWGLAEWDAHVESQPMIYRKLFYSPEVVAKCVMGGDE
jgi:hypothetical protein